MPRASLFEIETIIEDPANLNSADAEYIVTASDSMDYVVKTQRRHPAIPASEWICHRLAEACGIPTPQFAVIKMRDGTAGFGSQWDASVVANQALINSFLTVIPGPPTLAKIFTAIYVIDLFVHNEDRHSNNYLFVKTNRNVGVKVYDFSRALFFHGVLPLPALPMSPGTNTIKYGRVLRVGYAISRATIQETVRRIAVVSVATMEGWIDEMPQKWLEVGLRRAFLHWWDTASRNRALAIERGINDGSYL